MLCNDISLLVVGKFPNMVSGLMQWDLHTAETWCIKVGLSVNPDKLSSYYLQGEENSLVSLNHTFSGLL